MPLTDRTLRNGDRRRLHYRRSRNGCLTCKRRKVRCDEQTPACYNCQRLKIMCEWKHNESGSTMTTEATSSGLSLSLDGEASQIDELSYPSAIFDFASSTEVLEPLAMFDEDWFASVNGFTQTEVGSRDQTQPRISDVFSSPRPQPQYDVNQGIMKHPTVLDMFRILEPVENGPRETSLRALFDEMIERSPMVRHAMSAFEAVRSNDTPRGSHCRQNYKKAEEELSVNLHMTEGCLSVQRDQLKNVLTATFLLTYADFLTNHLDSASSHLANVYSLLQTLGHGAIGPTERRIISWIRLLDARAAAAGGGGHFVNDTSGMHSSSPSTVTMSETSSCQQVIAETDPREMVYNLLCQPGVDFFQETQTITGRIARLGHDRRSRGSVEDETEVMAAASCISQDLASLYDQKPAIMDQFLFGSIGVDTLAASLTMAIRRSFETFLANYYACCVHLHRVAHRHLPCSQQVITAIQKIRDIMHSMVENCESLPVNMLWPLFMWGSEEDDEEECRWILQTMRNSRYTATNAELAAKLLEVVQTRQREAGSRVDIHSICLELFRCTLVIV